MSDADLHFWFDPVCPFAWMTSKWVRMVAEQREYRVEWRLISLRLLNRHVDYDAQFPPEYEAGHTSGLHLLRVAARARTEHGPQALDPLYATLGRHVELSAAVDDASWDAEIREETDAALQLTGKDVGTPILHFRPPGGAAFFGPVISRLPSPEDAVALWDHVIALAGFAGFAELKRSLRERPQLPAFGVRPGEAGLEEDWHGGSRRQHR